MKVMERIRGKTYLKIKGSEFERSSKDLEEGNFILPLPDDVLEDLVAKVCDTLKDELQKHTGRHEADNTAAEKYACGLDRRTGSPEFKELVSNYGLFIHEKEDVIRHKYWRPTLLDKDVQLEIARYRFWEIWQRWKDNGPDWKISWMVWDYQNETWNSLYHMAKDPLSEILPVNTRWEKVLDERQGKIIRVYHDNMKVALFCAFH